LELGTVTNLPQEPNPSPNLFRLPEDRALINRLGFPNEGAAAVAHRIAACRKGLLAQLPLAVSIGKSRAVDVDPIEPAVADYIASFRLVKPVADMVVVNISSPNTKNLRAMQSAELARTLLSALVLENSTIAPRIPILVKVAPDLGDEDLEKLLSVIEELGIDGVVATNTTVSRFGLRTPDAVVDAMGAGGLSGPPLKARALAVVHRIRQRLGPKPVIVGVGGVETGADARAMLGAGANLIQLYTSFVYRGPMTPHAIAAELLAIAHQEGVKSVSEFVGVPPGV
jgi:dihydroorotate dehydrogenase